MILVEPEHGAGKQEAADFVAPVIENVGVPVGMKSLTPVGMLEQMGSVEIGQPVGVGREVRWHPIENHTDSTLVQVVNKKHKVLRRPIP